MLKVVTKYSLDFAIREKIGQTPSSPFCSTTHETRVQCIKGMKSIFNKLVGDRKQEGKQIKVGNYQVHIVKQIAEGMWA